MKMNDNATSRTSRLFQCWKCLVYFYLLFFCISGISIALFASFLLIFRQESHGLVPDIALYFLIVPTIFIIGSTAVGWSSIRRKNVTLVKFFAVLLCLTAVVEIGGSLWCFASINKTQKDVLNQMSHSFSEILTNSYSKAYWDNLQTKFKCCGFYGPSDYRLKEGLPFSCCGSGKEDKNVGSCTWVWQNGCSEMLSNRVMCDLIILGLVAIIIAFLQIPGAFFSWCFANRINKGTT